MGGDFDGDFSMTRRLLEKLSAREVTTLAKPGRHADGGNLYLTIDKEGGGRRWTFFYKLHGRQREMGLGPAPGHKKAGLSLRDARLKAADARRLLMNGIDPLAEKKAQKLANRTRTFGDFADELIASLAPGFKSEVHLEQWRMTLRDYAAPLRSMPLREIGTEDVLKILKPIWNTKHETASRLRGRIERVLDAATAKGLRSGENPARWRGHLKELLSKRQKLQRGHHGALPYKSVPAFVAELRQRKSVSALALEFTILTAARTGEVIAARRAEFDLEENTWTIPAERMKAGREHRVPLCDRAVEVIKELIGPGTELEPDVFIFFGRRQGEHLSNMAMLALLKEMRGKGATVHGFRSCFKDWASERTMHENIVTEMALAHTIGNAVEAAYRRGNLFEKRRSLMNDWSRYIEGTEGNVVQMARAT